jgi:hypothetical protein
VPWRFTSIGHKPRQYWLYGVSWATIFHPNLRAGCKRSLALIAEALQQKEGGLKKNTMPHVEAFRFA